MQQREQLILKKLAEAREAQAGSMTRFIQARARVMQVEARLQAVHARLAAQQTLAQPAEASIPSTNAAHLPAIPTPDTTILVAEDMAQSASTAQAQTPPAEQPLLRPETPAQITEQSISELATVMLTLEQPISQTITPEQADKPNDDEDTKKQPAIQLTRQPTPPAPSVQQNLDEVEALMLTLSEVAGTAQPDQAATNNDEGQANQQPADTNATDITTKIPVIRQESRKQRESK